MKRAKKMPKPTFRVAYYRRKLDGREWEDVVEKFCSRSKIPVFHVGRLTFKGGISDLTVEHSHITNN